MFHSRSPPSDSSSELYAFSSPLSSSSSSSPTTSSPVDFEACSTSSKCCAAAAAETSPAAASSADIAIGGGGTGSPPRERTRPHGRAEKARNLRAARASRERQRGAPEWFGRRGVGAFSRLRKPSKLPGVRHVRATKECRRFTNGSAETKTRRHPVLRVIRWYCYRSPLVLPDRSRVTSRGCLITPGCARTRRRPNASRRDVSLVSSERLR